MIFLRGFIHCDPHPGNVLVRAGEAGKAEIVLLDHGLYTVRWKTDYYFQLSVCIILTSNTIGKVTPSPLTPSSHCSN